jgi:hypothetical protein
LQHYAAVKWVWYLDGWYGENLPIYFLDSIVYHGFMHTCSANRRHAFHPTDCDGMFVGELEQ